MAGGTIPAGIWHDYMIVAKGENCDSFPQPDGAGGVLALLRQVLQHRSLQRRQLLPLATRPPGTGDNSAGRRQDYRGYDPRVYEAPPQQAPSSPEPPPAPEPPSDGGGGSRRLPDQGGGAGSPDE